MLPARLPRQGMAALVITNDRVHSLFSVMEPCRSFRVTPVRWW